MKSFIRRRLQMAGSADRGSAGVEMLFAMFAIGVAALAIFNLAGSGPGSEEWRAQVEKTAKAEGVSVVDVRTRLVQGKTATVRTDDGLLVDVEERDGEVVVPIDGGAQLLGPWLDEHEAPADTDK